MKHSLCSSPRILSDFSKKAWIGTDPSEPSGCFIPAGKTSPGSVSTATAFPSLWHSAFGITRSFAPAKQTPAGKKNGKSKDRTTQSTGSRIVRAFGKAGKSRKRLRKGAVPALPLGRCGGAGMWLWSKSSREQKLGMQPKGFFRLEEKTQGMLRSQNEGRSKGRPFLPTKNMGRFPLFMDLGIIKQEREMWSP